MKRFLITSPKFNGQAEIFYNASGLLFKIDLSNALMEPATIKAFKAAVPPVMDDLLKGEGFTADTTIIAADVEVSFDMFWNAYNKKINRIRAEKLWHKLTKVQQVNAFTGVAPYDKFLKKTDRFKADPETYIRNQYWLNEYK